MATKPPTRIRNATRKITIRNFDARTRTVAHGAYHTLWHVSVPHLKSMLRKLGLGIPKNKHTMVERLSDAYKRRELEIETIGTFTILPTNRPEHNHEAKPK